MFCAWLKDMPKAPSLIDQTWSSPAGTNDCRFQVDILNAGACMRAMIEDILNYDCIENVIINCRLSFHNPYSQWAIPRFGDHNAGGGRVNHVSRHEPAFICSRTQLALMASWCWGLGPALGRVLCKPGTVFTAQRNMELAFSMFLSVLRVFQETAKQIIPVLKRRLILGLGPVQRWHLGVY